MTTIDIEPAEGGGVLTFEPDPSIVGNAVLRFSEDDGATVLIGSYRIRDLLVILHATGGVTGRRPTWMGR